MDPVAHASIALMTKPLAPKAPLWALVVATEVPDLLFFVFEAAGLEHQAVTEVSLETGLRYLSPASLAWSHGFFMCVVWSLLVGLIAYAFLRQRRASAAIGLMVFSHWVLDFIVYNNLPLLFDGSPTLGLGLITSGPGLIAGILLEIVLIAGGIIVYWRWRAAKRSAAQAPQA